MNKYIVTITRRTEQVIHVVVDELNPTKAVNEARRAENTGRYQSLWQDVEEVDSTMFHAHEVQIKEEEK